MVYDDYKVHAEFESTGIKKLIRLFTYLQKMVRGEIVFIDEFDSICMMFICVRFWNI